MPRSVPKIAELTFFLDRGLGSKTVASVLRAAGWRVTTMNERYGARRGEGLSDAKWIHDAAGIGDTILCKDLEVGWVVAESRAIVLNDAHIFGLSNAQLPGGMMAAIFLLHEAAIRQLALRRSPYLFALTQGKCVEKKLAYPGRDTSIVAATASVSASPVPATILADR